MFGHLEHSSITSIFARMNTMQSFAGHSNGNRSKTKIGHLYEILLSSTETDAPNNYMPQRDREYLIQTKNPSTISIFWQTNETFKEYFLKLSIR